MTKKIMFLALVCLMTSAAYADSVCTAYCIRNDSTGNVSVTAGEVIKLTTQSVDEMFLKCMGSGARLVQLSTPVATDVASTLPAPQDYKIATAQNSCSDSIDPLIAEEEEVQDDELTQEALSALLEDPSDSQKETL